MNKRRNLKRVAVALEQSKWFVITAVIFRVLLEISYRTFVNPVFAYSGFVLDINAAKYIESWLIYLSLVFFSPKRFTKPSDYLMAYLLFAFLAPLLVFYSMANASREHLYIVLLAVVLIALFRNGRVLKIPFVRSGKTVAIILISLGALVVTLWMLASGGLNFFNLDLTRVYEFRRDVGEVINQGPMGYLNTWATKVFGPLALALALWKRKFVIAAFIVGLHVLWFGISSHKSVLFYPFLILFLWIWFRTSKALALIPLGMSFAVLVSLLIFIVTTDILAGSLFIRRVFYVPSFLTFTYYDFFSKNEFVYWSGSITSAFIEYPYHINTAALIGEFLGTEAHANNSFLSTGYMHAGLPGMVLYGVLVGLLFRLIDSLSSSGVPPWVAVSSILIPSQSLLISADLPTALLTHGIGFAVLLLFLLRSKAKDSGANFERDAFSHDGLSHVGSSPLR